MCLTGGMLLQMGSSFSRQKGTQFEQVPRTGFLSAGQWKQGRETKLPPASPSSDPRSSAFIRGRFRSSTGAPGAGTGRIRPSGIGRAPRSRRQAELAVEQFLRIVFDRVDQQALGCFQPGGRLETVAGGLDNELLGVVRADGPGSGPGEAS